MRNLGVSPGSFARVFLERRSREHRSGLMRPANHRANGFTGKKCQHGIEIELLEALNQNLGARTAVSLKARMTSVPWQRLHTNPQSPLL
jgi:hypothetical protein